MEHGGAVIDSEAAAGGPPGRFGLEREEAELRDALRDALLGWAARVEQALGAAVAPAGRRAGQRMTQR